MWRLIARLFRRGGKRRPSDERVEALPYEYGADDRPWWAAGE